MTSNERIEFGDFQTPPSLARAVCERLRAEGLQPATVAEPACGTGVFLEEAWRAFPSAQQLVGIDVHAGHCRRARRRMQELDTGARARIRCADFFALDCAAWIAPMQEPILVLGNPPWATNSRLAALGSRNRPPKDNGRRLRGVDAITGKSNFDVSQWMLERLLHALRGRAATLAMLCKTRVARDVLRHAWRNGWQIRTAATYGIDAQASFGAAVEACLLICRLGRPPDRVRRCAVHLDLDSLRPASDFGWLDGRLVHGVSRYRRVRHLAGASPYRWRSGVKHDCAAVMELKREGDRFRNVLGEEADLEEGRLYPLLKGSQLARGAAQPDRWLLLPQTFSGEDTGVLAQQSPRTWAYLQSHAERLDRRASAIYRGRPRYSIFGIGPYSFAPWKLAIAGFGKRLRFVKLGPWDGKPVLLDDTCYFLPCLEEEEADELLALLESPLAADFYSSLVFWDTKRPITAEILQMLDLRELRREVTHASAEVVLDQPASHRQGNSPSIAGPTGSG